MNKKVVLLFFSFLLLSIFSYSQNLVRIHYFRQSEDYTNWGLYVWGDATGGTVQNWNDGPIMFDGSDDFGVYKDISIVDSSTTFNFIVRSWNQKDGGDKNDNDGSLSEYWIIQGDETVYKSNPKKKKEKVGTVRVHYNREDNNYSSWGLFVWGEATNGVVKDWGNGPILFDGSDSFGVYKDVDIYDLNETFNIIVRTNNIKDGGDKKGLLGNVNNYWFLENDDTVYDYNPKQREIVGEVKIHYGRFDNDYTSTTLKVYGQAVDEATLQYNSEDSYGVFFNVPIYSLSETFSVEILKNGIVDSGSKLGLTGSVGEYWLLEGDETLFDYEPEKKKQIKGKVKFNYYREDGLYNNWELQAWGEALDLEVVNSFEGVNDFGVFTEIDIYELDKTFDLQIKSGLSIDGETRTNIDPKKTEYWLIGNDNNIYDYNPRQTKDYVRIHYYRDDSSYNNWGLFIWGDATNGVVQEWSDGPIPFEGNDEYGAYIDIEIFDKSKLFNIITRTSSVKDGGDKKGLRGDVKDYWFLQGEDTVYDYNPRKKEVVGQVRIHYGRFDDIYLNSILKVSGDSVDGIKEFVSFDGNDTFGIYKDVDVYSLSKSFDAEIINNNISDEGVKTGLTGNGKEYWILEGYSELFTFKPEKKKKEKNFTRVHYNRNDKSYDNWGLFVWGDAIGGVIKEWNEGPVDFEGEDEYGAYIDIEVVDINSTFNIITRTPSVKDGGDKKGLRGDVKDYWFLQGDDTVYDYNPLKKEKEGTVRVHYGRLDNNYNGYTMHTWGLALDGDNSYYTYDGEDSFGVYQDIDIYDLNEEFNLTILLNGAKDGNDRTGLKGNVVEYWILENDDILYDYEPQKRKEKEGTVRVHYHRFANNYSGYTMHTWGLALDGDKSYYTYDGEDSFGVYQDIDVYDLNEEFNLTILLNGAKDGNDKIGFKANVNEYWLLENDNTLYDYEPEIIVKPDKIKIHYHRFDGNYSGWGVHIWGDAYDGAEMSWDDGPKEFNQTDDFGVFIEIPIDKTGNRIEFIVRGEYDKDGEGKLIEKVSQTDYWVLRGREEVFLKKPSTANQFTKAEFVNSNQIYGLLSGTEGVVANDIKMQTLDGVNVDITDLQIDGVDVNIYFGDISFDKNYKLVVNGAEFFPRFSQQVLNEQFYYNGDDLGVTLTQNGALFKLWSPTSEKVKVNVYAKNGNTILEEANLTREEKGIWSIELNTLEDYDGLYYDFTIEAFGRTLTGCDPYTKSMKGKGIQDVGTYKGAIIDFSKTKTVSKMKNSDIMKSSTDIVMYELHIRDFTIDPLSGVEENKRGTYRGLIDKIQYLKDLGVTHVELMPVQNFGVADEYDKEFHSESGKYTWGYDTIAFFSPAGWYSEDPSDPYSRIDEFKDLIQAFHDADIAVVLDVVYNHTYSLDVLDNVAPKSYYRYKEDGSIVQGAGIGPMPETRMLMYRKLMIDSLKMFYNEYGIDGFRFDSMGHIDVTAMREVREAIGDDAIMTAEAWTTDIGHEGAIISNDYYPSDCKISGWAITARNGILNNTSYVADGSETGFIQKNPDFYFRAKTAIVGALSDYYNDGTIETYDMDRFAEEPDDTVLYVSAHDGFTLWDKINLTVDGDKWNRAKYAKFSYSMLFTSQSRIMLQAGDEFGRIKPLPTNGASEGDTAYTDKFNDEGFGTTTLRNSYNHGDHSNMVRWDRLNDSVFIGLKDYVKDLIKMRRAIPALRYSTHENIMKGLKFLGVNSPHYREYEGHRTFDTVPSLKIEFYNAPIENRSSRLYFIGEVYGDDILRENNKNSYYVDVDESGNGSITFTKDQIDEFSLWDWYNLKDLNFFLTSRNGDVSGKISSYTMMGNNRIVPFKIEKGNRIAVDLSQTDQTPNVFPRHYPDEMIIAYELDNTLESSGTTNYTNLVVVHNAEDYAVTVSSDIITNPSEWKVILDEDEAGVSEVDYTEVSIQNGIVIVPAKSSAVIAK